MKLGLYLRNMGPQSARATLLECARRAEAAGVDDLWVADHVAIPPDQSEGSDGRYLDPLATLAFFAGVTTRVQLGTAVLVAPYRPPLPTAKWVATIQELSAERLVLGVGVGWMAAEFRALGVPRAHRGRLTDELLAFLDRCFDADVVEANGQPFLFKPRPARPPIFIGGQPPYAFRRALAHRAGWMPMGLTPDVLRAPAATLRAEAAAAGQPPPEIAVLTMFPLDDVAAARATVQAYTDAGATRLIHGARYESIDDFRRQLDGLAAIT